MGACGTAAASAGALALPRRAAAGYKSSLWYRLVVPEIFEPSPAVPDHSPVVVIGTGFGGSISALRLAQAGVEVTLLERGFRWPTNLRWRKTFTSDFDPDGRGFWFRNRSKDFSGVPRFTDNFGGVVDVHDFENMRAFAGACVGGGSVVYNGVSIQPSRADFDHIFQGLLDFDELNEQHYPRVRSMLQVSKMPDDVYSSAPFGHYRIWDRDMNAAGLHSERCPTAMNWDVVREEIQFRRRRSALQGESIYGNSGGSKRDLTQNYLAMAEATGRATVYTGQQVKSITHDGSRYIIDIEEINPEGWVLSRSRKTCDALIMAAGSLGTTKLLLKAKSEGEMPQLNDEIGQGWGSNGDVALVRSGVTINSLQQPSPCASYYRGQADSSSVTMESWYAPGVPVSTGGSVTLAMVASDRRGHFSYNSVEDKLELAWSRQYNEEVENKAKILHTRLREASNTRPGGFAGAFPEASGNFTAHPLGGVVLGKAADATGRVHGYRHLYVMDGAMIPGSTGAVNPSLTIAAIVERNIAKVIREDLRS